MGRAVDRILAAVEARQRILVYGDYDVDGLTGACLLWHFLRAIGARAEVFIPDRLADGYGLSANGMGQVLAEPPEVLITVDHGVTACEQVARLTAAGVDVIVTDHHQKPEVLPEAYALLNPLLLDEADTRHLSGAGVAFKLACAVFQALPSSRRRQPRLREILTDGLAFAALGTIADIVPLVGENRILVRHGLERLAVSSLPGLRALRNLLGPGRDFLDTEDVSFGLAPRLNAAGRLGRVDLARGLLLASDDAEAGRLARQIDALNDERKGLQEEVTRRALDLARERPADEPVLCIADAAIHPGVMGIVASRLSEEYGKPTLLMSIEGERARGSGRSLGEFDLARALRAVGHLLHSHGGHAAAAGLEMDPARIDELRDELCQVAARETREEAAAVLDIDSELHLHQIDLRLFEELYRVAPFGMGNPRPLFVASNVRLADPPRRVGPDGAHLLLKLEFPRRPLSAIAFRQGHRMEEAQAEDLTLAFSLRPSNFPGPHRFQLLVEDLRSSASGARPAEDGRDGS
jgi:single-stranded-DNA-specific exonuclease